MGGAARRRHVCEWCCRVFACDPCQLPQHRFQVKNILITVCGEECRDAYQGVLDGRRPRVIMASYEGRGVGLPPPEKEELI